jgi:hypothetical protein
MCTENARRVFLCLQLAPCWTRRYWLTGNPYVASLKLGSLEAGQSSSRAMASDLFNNDATGILTVPFYLIH